MGKIYMVDAFKHYEPHVIACYVLQYEKPVLIDPGPQSGVHNVIEELKRLRVKPEVITLTHVHLDHAGGAATLAKHLSAKVVVHPRGAKHIVDPTRLWEASREVQRELADVFGKPNSLEESMVVVTEDCQELDLGEDKLVILHAPGHAPHMQVYYLKEAKVLFPADAVGVGFDGHLIPSTSSPFDYSRALRTLERLRKLKVESVALTHFGLTGKEVIERAEDKIREWYEIATSCRDINELIERLLRKDEDVSALHKKYPENSVLISFFKASVQGIFRCAKGI